MINEKLIASDKTPKLTPPIQGFSGRVQERLQSIQKLNQKLYPLFFRVYANTASPSKAIKAKCLDCSCWQRDEITHCNAVTCPLHNLRPYQEAKTKQ